MESLPQSQSNPVSIGSKFSFTVTNRTNESFFRFIALLDWSPGKTKHCQTFDAFLRAESLGVDPRIAHDEVVRCILAAGGVLHPDQVARQQRRAIEFISGQRAYEEPVGPPPPRATFCPGTLKRVASIVNFANPIEALRMMSPIDPATVTAGQFLGTLYSYGERVVVFVIFESQGQHVFHVGVDPEPAVPTAGPDGVWFLVQPVDGLYHPNPRNGGKRSRRSQESVTAWRHLVLESDEADAGDWVRALVQLPLKIVAVYTSGGKSIHALVRVDADSKVEWDRFKRSIEATVVTLGADRGALSAVRLSRLPQCWRGDRLQQLLYLDPEADGTPISSRLL